MSLRFADGKNEALVALVVREFQQQITGYLGRTAVQKLCYFSRELGVPFSYRFSMYFYGPYSDGLASDLDFMLADKIIVDSSNDRERYSNFRLGPQADELFSRHKTVVDQWTQQIGRVATAFGRCSPETLELLSTVHFVSRRFKAAGEAPSEENVVEAFRGQKGDKFDPSDIIGAYRALDRAGLLQ